MAFEWLSTLGSVLNTVSGIAQSTAPLWTQYLPQPRQRAAAIPPPPMAMNILPPTNGVYQPGGGRGLPFPPRGGPGGYPVAIPGPREGYNIGRDISDILFPPAYRSRKTGRMDQPIPPIPADPGYEARRAGYRTTDSFGTGGFMPGSYSDWLMQNYSACAPRTRTTRRRSLYLAIDSEGNPCWRKRRYMNVTNVRALRRSIRRVKGFERLAKSVVRMNVGRTFRTKKKKGCCK